MRLRARRGVLGALACLMAGTAGADPLVPERAFPGDGACYGRVYDADHLARHAGQIVAEIYAWGSARDLVAARKFRGDIDPELPLNLRIVTTDGRRAEHAMGCAEIGGKVTRCGSAACAGDFGIDMAGGRLRLTNDNRLGRDPTTSQRKPGFGVGVSCHGSEGVFVPPDAENRVFLLARMPVSACLGAGRAR